MGQYNELQDFVPGALPTDEEYEEMMNQYAQEVKERNSSSIVVEINGVRIYLKPGQGVSIR